MLTYDIELVKYLLAKYNKILAAYELMRAVTENCSHIVLPQNPSVLAKAITKIDAYCQFTEQNISICRQITETYQKQQIIDKENYAAALINVSKNLAGLYKLNLLLFDELLIGADLIKDSYLDDNDDADDDLSEFYQDDALMELTLAERMEKMQCSDYTEFCHKYPYLVTEAEFAHLVKAGMIISADDTIVHKGRLYENEFSEQWEEYEYEYDKYRKKR